MKCTVKNEPCTHGGEEAQLAVSRGMDAADLHDLSLKRNDPHGRPSRHQKLADVDPSGTNSCVVMQMDAARCYMNTSHYLVPHCAELCVK